MFIVWVAESYFQLPMKIFLPSLSSVCFASAFKFDFLTHKNKSYNWLKNIFHYLMNTNSLDRYFWLRCSMLLSYIEAHFALKIRINLLHLESLVCGWVGSGDKMRRLRTADPLTIKTIQMKTGMESLRWTPEVVTENIFTIYH